MTTRQFSGLMINVMVAKFCVLGANSPLAASPLNNAAAAPDDGGAAGNCEPNGCGGWGIDFCRWGGNRVCENCQYYRSLFVSNCNDHDDCYSRCCCKLVDLACNHYGRLSCDRQFRDDMISTCYAEFPRGNRRDECIRTALCFYDGVRALGYPSWKWACTTCRRCPGGPGAQSGKSPDSIMSGEYHDVWSDVATPACEFSNHDSSCMSVVDTDGDGIPDDLEMVWGLSPSDPEDAFGDPDGDGLNNHDELLFGFDPYLVDSDGDGRSDEKELARALKRWKKNPSDL